MATAISFYCYNKGNYTRAQLPIYKRYVQRGHVNLEFRGDIVGITLTQSFLLYTDLLSRRLGTTAAMLAAQYIYISQSRLCLITISSRWPTGRDIDRRLQSTRRNKKAPALCRVDVSYTQRRRNESQEKSWSIYVLPTRKLFYFVCLFFFFNQRKDATSLMRIYRYTFNKVSFFSPFYVCRFEWLRWKVSFLLINV